LEDKSKPDDVISEKPSDETKDKEIEQPQKEIISDTTGKKEEITEESKIEDKKEKIKKEKVEQEIDKKVEKKKEDKKKKSDKKPDFKYIVRLSNSDINGEKNVVYGLASIKGVGLHMATLIADKAGINRYTKIGDLSDAQVEKLQESINDIGNTAPGWMLNHRKDYDTGEDLHLVSSEIDLKLRDEINIMKKIRSYRGIRHERGLPVRGQRTRANNRKGLALGVSKKKVQTK
jgi:small subunit ribosomal protein S13